MQICFLITKYEQIVKLKHLLCPKGGGHKPTCAPSPTHFWKWGHVPTLPPFSYASEYKSKTFILDMPLSRSVCIYSKRDVIYTIDRMAFHKTNTHDLQCTIKLIWLDVYWNLIQTKSAYLFTSSDAINYCSKNFAWTHKTVINLIHGVYIMRVGFIKCQDSVRV